jgi:hypothetical protein
MIRYERKERPSSASARTSQPGLALTSRSRTSPSPGASAKIATRIASATIACRARFFRFRDWNSCGSSSAGDVRTVISASLAMG